ncbi:MAG TPA: hypothetical protein VF516_35305 [Kofleriaceae bacterium]
MTRSAGHCSGPLAGELPDPADRMRVAPAIIGGLTLVTADAVLLDRKLRGVRTRDASERCGGDHARWRHTR